MAAKAKKSFLDTVEKRLKEGFELTSDIGKDYAVDKAVVFAPQAAALAVNKLEQGRRFLQQGTVPGAREALSRTVAQAGTLKKFFGNLRNAPQAQAVMELGKASYLIGKEGARKGHAEAGKELMQKPLAYQAANLLVSPADAMSKYGAAREVAEKKVFMEPHMLLLRAIAEKEEEDRRNSDVPPVDIRKETQPNARKFFK